MEHPKSAGFFWQRKKHTPSAGKGKRGRSNGTFGAHEYFLEREGYLPPEHPTSASRPAGMHKSTVWQSHNAKTSQDSGRASAASQTGLRRSFSNFSATTAHSNSALLDPVKRRKRSILSFSHSINEDSHMNISSSRRQQSQVAERNHDGRPRHFLRRCMSIRSQGRPPTPSSRSPMMLESPSASGYLPAPVPEFGLIPGFGYEPPRAPADLSSGAAARAAAAAQNEILATMRSLSLAGTQINRDSESGVGIEVRDQADVGPGLEIPIVRQGMRSEPFLEYFVF